MIKLKNFLFEDKTEKEIKRFEEFKGSYSFQGHISTEKEIELQSVSPIVVGDKSGWSVNLAHYSPPHGFWTSSIYKSVNEFKTKWQEFWHEGEKSISKSGRYLHAFTIDGNPNIVHLGSKKEAEKYYRQSSYATESGDLIPILRWEQLAENKDGFHVYGSALQTEYFKSWDIESTVWFNPKKYLKKQFVWKLD